VSGDAGQVRVTRDGQIVTVTFDRPSARNAMTWAMYEQLDSALDQLASEPDVRVAVLRGTDGNFVSGTDISQFVDFKSGSDGVEYERRLEAVVSKLETTRVATIAAVDGYALGGGLALAAVCDLRICTPRARFGVPIAKTVGNCLSIANYARLVASLGASRTKAMLFTAETMSADEALALGFVSSVVEPSGFDAAVAALSARVASHAPITLQVTKEAMRRIVSVSAGQDGDLVQRAYGSSDFREGVSAFLEKRSARWEGR
jgi:enoyl-CoA hydratase/carnithine racemase